MTLRRHWWTACAAGLMATYAIVSLNWPRGLALVSFGDIAQLLLLCLASAVMTANAVSNRGQTRLFWFLMAIGCVMWTANQAMWTFYEVVLRRALPDPFVGDVILFLHVVPLMAAVALRPHRPPEGQKLYFSTLNFLMLLVWWMFLYAFIVFPDEYVILDKAVYSRSYDLLYLGENLALLAVLGVLASSTGGAWRSIYRNLFIASAIYSLSSEAMNAAIARGQYYTGSWYDIPFIASICWMIWASILAWELRPTCEPAPPGRRWLWLASRVAMLAILSLPVMGYWAWFGDTAPARIRQFRILVTLAAMLVLGFFIFIRQYLLDRELVRLLEESRQSLENLQRLQTQLVQREKLASLGQLVAGAAHEINNPLAAILGYSELLATSDLPSKQVTMAQKIGQQARRTRELVSGLLSFAQQSPGEKTLLNVGSVLQRALQMQRLRLESKNIRVESSIASDLPWIWGNTNQLFQCCLEIISNATDALEEVGGGTLSLSSRHEDEVIVLEFSDSGPGIRQPQRVFDPFYTTKPIGKGTGLGLSATYGVVQDHQGQITCHNRPEGGAVFVMCFPVVADTVPASPEAAGL
jgi:signal transduction histidine kinase